MANLIDTIKQKLSTYIGVQDPGDEQFIYFWEDIEQELEVQEVDESGVEVSDFLSRNFLVISTLGIVASLILAFTFVFLEPVYVGMGFLVLALVLVVISFFHFQNNYSVPMRVIQNQVQRLSEHDYSRVNLDVVAAGNFETVQLLEDLRIDLSRTFDGFGTQIKTVEHDMKMYDFAVNKTANSISNSNLFFENTVSHEFTFQEMRTHITTASAGIDEFVGNFDDALQLVNSVIRLLKSIGRQATMFALNAGIEAAKSEEHSVGFEIVAANLRRMSQHTLSEANIIKEQVKSISSNAMNSIENVTSSMQTLNRQINQLFTNVEKIQDEIETISRSFNDMSRSYEKMQFDLNEFNNTITEYRK